jgi:hypothetical protein
MSPTVIAYLLNQYPKVSHSFIRREIRALERQGLEVHRWASRGWDTDCPDLADQASERRRDIEHKALEAQTQQGLGERAAQRVGLARLNQGKKFAGIGRRESG